MGEKGFCQRYYILRFQITIGALMYWQSLHVISRLLISFYLEWFLVQFNFLPSVRLRTCKHTNKVPFLSSQLTQELLLPNWSYRQERIDLFCFSCNFYLVKSHLLRTVKKAKQKTHFVLWRGMTTTYLRWRFSRVWFKTPIEFGGIFLTPDENKVCPSHSSLTWESTWH